MGSCFVDAIVRATDFEWLFAWADRGPATGPDVERIADPKRWRASLGPIPPQPGEDAWR